MTALVDPLSMFRLEGKVALVTGGGSGIGRATAAALAGADAAVAILDIDLTRAETAAREITTRGGVASGHQADVTDQTSVERAIDAIVAHHGGLDILVNSAGIGIRRAAVELSLSDWDKVVAVNLTGVFLCSQAAARVMLRRCARFVADSALEEDGFELPVAREIAEACRRHEQTVGRWTRHLAPWRSSESDGPSVGAYVFNRPASFASVTGLSQHCANEWARSMAAYGANGFSNALKPSSPPQPFRAVWRSGPRKRLMPEKRTRSADQRQQYQPKDE